MSTDSESCFITVCGWCRRVKMEDGTWMPTEAVDEGILTHGICPECYHEMMAQEMPN